MDNQLAASLLDRAMDAPGIVDDLWQAKHGTPEDRDGLGACLRLDRLLGGSGKPDSTVAVELSYNAGGYLEFLMDPGAYPKGLKARAEAEFPPFGKQIEWETPKGFRRDKGLLALIDKLINKQVQAKLRPDGLSLTLIVIRKPTPTQFVYPWQQAVNANYALSAWNPATMERMFPRISSSYVRAGRTKVYQVCFRHGTLECAKVPVLIQPGIEQLFEFQTLSLSKEKSLFDDFIFGLS